MRKFLLLLLVLWITAEKAPAETRQSGSDWEAVGRVNLKGTGFCTGSLISPKLVLTAAHCMFDKRTGQPVRVEDIEFLAGWQGGQAAAQRRAARVVLHPKYQYRSSRRLDRVAADIALIELAQPIHNARIVPYGWARRPKIGQDVQVVSYSKDRAQQQSMQETCRVLGRDPSVLVLSCEVSYGASGSPIFVVQNGVPRIASVVSAKAEWKDRDVALGASLGRPLEELIHWLETNDAAFGRIEPVSSGLNDN